MTSSICDVCHLFAQITLILHNILLPHRDRVAHICVNKLTSIGSDNGLSPNWHKAIIWTSGESLLIRSFGTNLSENLIEIHTFSFKKIYLKMSSGKWWPFILSRPQCVLMKSYFALPALRRSPTQNPLRRLLFSYFAVILNSRSLWLLPQDPILANILLLTHWGRDKIVANFLTFSNAFSWMKIYKFRSRFHWSLFPRVQLTIC